MERYQNNIQDTLGNAIGAVTVTVRLESTGAIASIFSDNAGTGKANPFTNDSDGEFFFYAVNDRYDIFLTGPITDQKDDVILFDAAGRTQIDAFTDIVTATPPVAELVTGGFRILDKDGSDVLAEVGFFGGNALRFKNKMHGGGFAIECENSAGVNKTVVNGDPDSGAAMFFAGIKRFETDASGAVRILGDDNVDTSIRRLDFRHADNTLRALIGQNGSTSLLFSNTIHGGNLEFLAEDAGGATRTILIGDPDAVTTLRGDTEVQIRLGGTENELALRAFVNGSIDFYNNGIVKLRTVLETATDQISGAEMLDGEGNFRPAGIGTSNETVLSATGTTTPFSQARALRWLTFTGATASNWDTFASTGASQTDIPPGAMWFGANDGAGTLTIRGGASVVFRHWTNAGATPPDADVTIGRGQIFTLKKVSDILYDIWTN